MTGPMVTGGMAVSCPGCTASVAPVMELGRRSLPRCRAWSAEPAGHARQAQWVQRRLVGEVAFTEWTAELLLRHPSWRGLRTDKDPGDISPDR